MEILMVVFLIIFVVYFGFFGPSSAKILGNKGEKQVRRRLRKLDKSRYTVINDVVFDIKGKKSQIDHLVVSDYGVFVIETKNYKGSIYGSEYKEYWSQYLFKKRFKLYNPIKQNQGHIYALQYVLKGLLPIEFISLIVFTDRAKVKVRTNTPVIHPVRLVKTIKSYDEVTLNHYMKDAIIETIKKHNIK